MWEADENHPGMFKWQTLGDIHAAHVYALQKTLNKYTELLRVAQYNIYGLNQDTLKRLIDLTAEQIRKVTEIRV